jgi:hypothetical protein
MNALVRIRSAGFEVRLKDNGNIGIKPFDALTPQQLDYLKTHKAEIVEALAASDVKPAPAPATDPLLVTVYTPSGTAMTIQADNAEYVAWLRRMNPKSTNPAPKPNPTPEPDADRISEAEHAAQGRFFKFLVTRPNGSQYYSCSMPRMVLSEVRAQYPEAANIQSSDDDVYCDEQLGDEQLADEVDSKSP